MRSVRETKREAEAAVTCYAEFRSGLERVEFAEHAMGNYVGISLVGDDWCVAPLEISSDAAIPLDAHAERLPENLSTRTILRNLEEATSLQRYFTKQVDRALVTRNEAHVCQDVAQEIRNADLRRYFNEYVVNASELVGTIGIAHPYGLSPTIRRALPALIGWDPIVQHRVRRNERVSAIHPKTNESAARACAVEFPFAASLELLARRNVSPPALIVILGEAVNGIEVTVVSVLGDEATWRLSAEDYFVGTADEMDVWSRTFVKRMAGGKLADATVIVIHFVEADGPCAASLAKLMAFEKSSPRTEKLEPTDLASGAARYAALCSGEKAGIVVGADGIEKIEFTSIAPFSIGVCGQNRQGEVRWCPLFEAGDPLETGNSQSVRFAGDRPLPSRFILAECLQRDRCPGEWVTDPLLLRWYAEVPVDVPREAREGTVDITIESSTECWAYGWSDPFIRGSFAVGAN